MNSTSQPQISMILPTPGYAYDAVVVIGKEEIPEKVVYCSSAGGETHNVRRIDKIMYRATRIGHLDHEPRFRIKIGNPG